MPKRDKFLMLLSTQKQNSSLSIALGSFSGQLLLLVVIGALIVLSGFFVGTTSQQVTTFAQSAETLSQQATGSNAEVSGVSAQQESPKYFSQTEVASEDDGSLLTSLLAFGALTFAMLGAVRVYKVMTGKS